MAKRKKPSKEITKSGSLYDGALKRHQAVQEIAKEFLCFALSETRATKLDIERRDEKIADAVDDAGGLLSSSDIKNLFGILEEIACKKINEIAALAQTTDPDKAKELTPNLPMQLVNNTKASRLAGVKGAFTERARKGADAKEANRPQEEKDRKNAIHLEWLRWQETPHLYKSISDFATFACQKHPDASYDTITKKWMPEWRDKRKSQHSS